MLVANYFLSIDLVDSIPNKEMMLSERPPPPSNEEAIIYDMDKETILSKVNTQLLAI